MKKKSSGETPLELWYGAEGQNRTADTGIFSPLLYRLSYLGSLNPTDFNAEIKMESLLNAPFFVKIFLAHIAK